MIFDLDYKWDDVCFFIKRCTKFPLQRMIRGWDDRDWWNLNTKLAKDLVGMLTKLRDEGHGFWSPHVTMPGGCGFCHGVDVGEDQEAKEWWHDMLTEMIDGFQAYLDRAYEYETAPPKTKKALKHLAKYFDALWD